MGGDRTQGAGDEEQAVDTGLRPMRSDITWSEDRARGARPARTGIDRAGGVPQADALVEAKGRMA